MPSPPNALIRNMIGPIVPDIIQNNSPRLIIFYVDPSNPPAYNVNHSFSVPIVPRQADQLTDIQPQQTASQSRQPLTYRQQLQQQLEKCRSCPYGPCPDCQQEIIRIEEELSKLPKPLDPEIKDTFKIIREKCSCSICLEDTEETEIYCLPCGHKIHKECGDKWFKDADTCPICRQCFSNTPIKD